MRPEFNIYCDESCHLLQKNNGNVMVLGAITIPKHKKQEIFNRIRDIKVKHGLNSDFEIKWHKVSESKINFYLDIIDYFFDDNDLNYRAIVIPDKSALNHQHFNQDHDTFYYKMYFDLLKVILSPEHAYNIYIDIKDTRGQQKVEKLKQVLRNNHYDYHNQIIKEVQQVQSHEVQVLQVTDLLTGAISYLHRGLNTSTGKLKIIEKIKHRSGYGLIKSTLYREEKMNIFIWRHSIVSDGN